MTGVAAVSIGVYGVSEAAAQPVEARGPAAEALTPFKDPLRIPPVLRPKRDGVTEIVSTRARVRLHSELPLTPMWTYQGHFPGPTIEARRGERVRIAWRNNLTGTTPLKGVWVAPAGPVPGFAPYNRPGAEGGRPRPEVAGLTAWTSTHLHGGDQHALSDGGSETGVMPGGSQLAEYPNETAAAHLFYHDHAMPVTALNVLAGLMGHYLVRDPREARLGLPSGAYEIPLAIADANFDTDKAGRLTGQLLVKRISLTPPADIDDKALPPSIGFLGPYTMVNGVVWPHLDVEARAYRFRIVNAALNRPYRIVVVDEQTGEPVRGAMTLIGTDLGLLGKPVVIDEAVSLNPAERADVIIDFARFPGRRLRLVNTLPGVPAGTPVPDAALAFPDIMQFRVARKTRAAYLVPRELAADFRRLTAADVPARAVERFVLVTIEKNMPLLWELAEVPGDTQLGAGVVQVGSRTFRRVARLFEEPPTFYAEAGGWEKWTFLNISPPTAAMGHPMHIHQLSFQVIERRALDIGGFDFEIGGTRTPVLPGAALPIEPAESGWKDTVVVGASSLVTVAGRYGQRAGRYMYHCHLLDHEDEGMMRPLMLLPPAVLDVHHRMAGMHSAAGGHHG